MNWEVKKGFESIEFFNGKSIKVENEVGLNPIYGSNGKIGTTNKSIYNDAIIIGRVGAYCGAVQIEKGDFWATDNTIVVKAKEENQNMFWYYLLHNSRLNNFAGGSAQPLITQGTLKELNFFVPALETQKRIANILSTYDDLIENNLKRIKLLEETAQNIYKEWFVNFRFPNYEHTELDAVSGLPVGWEIGSFYDFVDIMSGGTPKTNVAEYYDGNIPFYTPKDASSNSFVYINSTEKNITEIGLQKCNSKLYPQNTVFITARGTVGKVNLAMRPMAMNQSCYALKLKNGQSPFFLLATTFEAVEIIKKTATGGVFDTIIVDTFKRIPIVFPDQKSITNYHNLVEPIFQQTIKIQEQISLLKEARDILLPRLMNRTIEV